MGLLHSFENIGNWLFKRRGWLPVVLFLFAVPVIFITDYNKISNNVKLYTGITAVVVSFIGLMIRAYTVGTTPKGTSGRNTDEQISESLNSTGIYCMGQVSIVSRKLSYVDWDSNLYIELVLCYNCFANVLVIL